MHIKRDQQQLVRADLKQTWIPANHIEAVVIAGWKARDFLLEERPEAERLLVICQLEAAMRGAGLPIHARVFERDRASVQSIAKLIQARQRQKRRGGRS